MTDQTRGETIDTVERYLKEDDRWKKFLVSGKENQNSKQETSKHAVEKADASIKEMAKHMDQHKSMLYLSF